MPMDERWRGVQNRQIDVHVRSTDPGADAASRRIGRRGLAIAIGIFVIAILTIILVLTH